MIYFDNAATTPVSLSAQQTIQYYNTVKFFNPSARYNVAGDVFIDIKQAREQMANLIGADDGSEIYYMSSGSESDNFVLKGAIRSKKDRLIISATEHPAVYNTAIYLKNKGYDVQIADVNRDGSINIDSLISLLTPDTRLVSIMHVNNETGVINDLKNIVEIVKSMCPQVLVHSDGVQAFGKIKVDVSKLGVDIYTIGGHKIHAPKGIALTYIKRGVNLNPLIHGGGQENGVRSSTENVSGIMALSVCAKEIVANIDENNAKISQIRQYICDEFVKNIPDIHINQGSNNVPHILSISIPSIRGEVLVHCLETENIYISTGSACSTKKGISRIPKAIGLSKQLAEGTIRLSFSGENTLQEAQEFCTRAINYIKQLGGFRRK